MKIVIDGVPLFDGAYELDDTASPFKMSDLTVIKNVSGVRAGELNEALEAGDSDVMVALAVIALIRAGAVRFEQARKTADILLDAPLGAITVLADETEPDPPTAPTGAE